MFDYEIKIIHSHISILIFCQFISENLHKKIKHLGKEESRRAKRIRKTSRFEELYSNYSHCTGHRGNKIK